MRGGAVSLADEIRAYVDSNYVQPARRSGQSRFEVVVGEVHTVLGYKNRLPAVCAALGTERFEQESRVRRVSIEGPLNGSTTLFTFELLP